MKITKTLLFFVCLVLYYFFFWGEEFGLNLLIFNSILLIYNYSQMPKNNKTYLLILSGFFSTLSVVLINTSFNKIVNILIMTVVFGYQLLPTINSAFSAGLIYFSNIIRNIKYLGAPFSKTIEGMAPKSVILGKSLKVLQISILPIILLVVFTLIFQNANPIFFEKTLFLQNLVEMFFKEFPTFSFPKLIYTIFGYIFLLGIFFYRDFELGKSYLTVSNTQVIPTNKIPKPEFFQTYVASLVLVNLLLLFVNAIDVQYLWFNFTEIAAPELSRLVHNGTNLLIMSILISIAILLFFFNGELNFHSKNRLTVSLANVWIIQNIVLLVSVFIRNYKYVELYGLTQKRIGVYIFLVMTLIGLITLSFKIIKKLNINYLINSNSWVYMQLFLVLSFVNFDCIIAKDNLQRANCDINYVKRLSTRAVPVILKYRPQIKKEELQSYNNFKKESKKHTWLSWNWADYKLTNLK